MLALAHSLPARVWVTVSTFPTAHESITPCTSFPQVFKGTVTPFMEPTGSSRALLMSPGACEDLLAGNPALPHLCVLHYDTAYYEQFYYDLFSSYTGNLILITT